MAPDAPASRRRMLVLLASVGVLAAVLRAIGLGYGLPAVYNPDEVAIMNRALGFAQGDLNPHNFLYPTLYFYVLFVWEGLWFVVGRAAGVFDSLAAFERSFFVDPTAIYLAGRALTLVCGVLTVWATYALGRRQFDRTTGIVAALLLAVAPLAVRDSHYIKHDVPATLLIALALVALAGATAAPAERRRWLLAGALAGLAMSTHYYAIFLAAPLGLLALRPDATGSSAIARLGLAGGACALAFFAASPFLLVEPASALRDIAANREIVVDRATSATGVFGSAPFYFSWLAGEAAGRITFLLAAIGALLACGSGWRPALLALGFPAAFLLFISNTYPASRYLNPVLPFVAILAGRAASWIAARGGWARAVAMALVAAAAADAGAAAVRTGLFFRQTDTRTLALEWIERNIPAGAAVLIQPYSVPLRPSRDGLMEALTLHLGSPDRASVRFQRQLALDPYPSPAYRTIYLGTGGLDVDKIYVAQQELGEEQGLARLRELAVTYVVLKRYNVPDPSLTSLDAALSREGRLLAAFSPYRGGPAPGAQVMAAPFLHNTDARIDSSLERPGPTIEIWTIQR